MIVLLNFVFYAFVVNFVQSVPSSIVKPTPFRLSFNISYHCPSPIQSITCSFTGQNGQKMMNGISDSPPPATESKTVKTDPVEKSESVPTTLDAEDEKISIVLWEATVTGRRLIDEMINLGSYTCSSGGTEEEFNEYVMPYGKLPLNVIRNYNLRIVDTGRYRMLKEIRNNKMLKSKSEVAACNDFAAWLQSQAQRSEPGTKIILVFFEPRHSKILQLFQVNLFYKTSMYFVERPLTKIWFIQLVNLSSLQALERYRLLDDVKKILLGCVNGWDLLRQQVSGI